METFFILLKTITLSWWLSNFTPYQDFLKKYVKPRIPLKLNYLSTLLSCFTCHSFWITLGWTQNIFIASGAAMIAYTYDKIMNSLKYYL